MPPPLRNPLRVLAKCRTLGLPNGPHIPCPAGHMPLSGPRPSHACDVSVFFCHTGRGSCRHMSAVHGSRDSTGPTVVTQDHLPPHLKVPHAIAPATSLVGCKARCPQVPGMGRRTHLGDPEMAGCPATSCLHRSRLCWWCRFGGRLCVQAVSIRLRELHRRPPRGAVTAHVGSGAWSVQCAT